MSVETSAARNSGGLPPVRRRATRIAWGLALQVIGVGIPVTAALQRVSSDGALANITHYSARLVRHEMLRSHADLALIVLGVIFFAAGAVVLARPFRDAPRNAIYRGPPRPEAVFARPPAERSAASASERLAHESRDRLVCVPPLRRARGLSRLRLTDLLGLCGHRVGAMS